MIDDHHLLYIDQCGVHIALDAELFSNSLSQSLFTALHNIVGANGVVAFLFSTMTLCSDDDAQNLKERVSQAMHVRCMGIHGSVAPLEW